MKKVLSLLLVVSMLFTFSAVVFAGSWQEHEANLGVKEFCQNEGCTNECSGTFGCTCCDKCPNLIDHTGAAVNVSRYSPCHFDFYFDLDEMDSAGNIIHTGTNKTQYYWKVACCDECTGRTICKCNCGCQYCVDPYADNEDLQDKIDDAQQSAQNGFINGIQSALKSLRQVMNNLFKALFDFIRIDEIIPPKK